MGTRTRHAPDYITSNEYFMGIAYLASKRSDDPNMRVGACIVNEDKNIVGIGYNDMPIENVKYWNTGLKKYYVIHAEDNAIRNTNPADLKNCTIYVTLHPCDKCANLIIESGIKHIVYTSNVKAHKKRTIAAVRLLEKAGITKNQFKHDNLSQLEVDLYGDPQTKQHVQESGTLLSENVSECEYSDMFGDSGDEEIWKPESSISRKRKRDEDGNESSEK